jgi:hypothetical protein
MGANPGFQMPLPQPVDAPLRQHDFDDCEVLNAVKNPLKDGHYIGCKSI